jgi:hypothetical protein
MIECKFVDFKLTPRHHVLIAASKLYPLVAGTERYESRSFFKDLMAYDDIDDQKRPFGCNPGEDIMHSAKQVSLLIVSSCDDLHSLFVFSLFGSLHEKSLILMQRKLFAICKKPLNSDFVRQPRIGTQK